MKVLTRHGMAGTRATAMLSVAALAGAAALAITALGEPSGMIVATKHKLGRRSSSSSSGGSGTGTDGLLRDRPGRRGR